MSRLCDLRIFSSMDADAYHTCSESQSLFLSLYQAHLPALTWLFLWGMQNSAAKKSASMFFYVSNGLDQLPGELSLSLAQ